MKKLQSLLLTPKQHFSSSQFGFQKLKGVSVLQPHNDNLLTLSIKNEPFTLKPSSPILTFQQFYAQNKRIYPITFYNAQTKEQYSATTPLQFVVNEDFLLNIRGEIYYIYVKNSIFSPQINLKNYNQFKNLYNIHYQTQKDLVQLNIEQKLIRNIINHLQSENPIKNISTNNNKNNKSTKTNNSVKNQNQNQNQNQNIKNNNNNQKLSHHNLHTLIVLELQKLAVERKQKIQQYDEILALLLSEKQSLEIEKQNIENKAAKKARSAYKKLFTFYGIQALMLQYGTYFMFSWDIIEPIVCLCTTFDMIIAYYFWLRHGNQFSFSDVWNRKQIKIQNKILNKEEFPLERLEEVLDLIKTFEAKKALLSLHMEEVVQGIQNDL